MFILHVPKFHKVGDTMDCHVNGDPVRVTWRDEKTLRIEPDDVRPIIRQQLDGDLICFICADAGMSEEEFEVFSAPDGFVVAAKGGGADSSISAAGAASAG